MPLEENPTRNKQQWIEWKVETNDLWEAKNDHTSKYLLSWIKWRMYVYWRTANNCSNKQKISQVLNTTCCVNNFKTCMVTKYWSLLMWLQRWQLSLCMEIFVNESRNTQPCSLPAMEFTNQPCLWPLICKTLAYFSASYIYVLWPLWSLWKWYARKHQFLQDIPKSICWEIRSCHKNTIYVSEIILFILDHTQVKLFVYMRQVISESSDSITGILKLMEIYTVAYCN